MNYSGIFFLLASTFIGEHVGKETMLLEYFQHGILNMEGVAHCPLFSVCEEYSVVERVLKEKCTK